jgi:hypothetical protein
MTERLIIETARLGGFLVKDGSFESHAGNASIVGSIGIRKSADTRHKKDAVNVP